MITNFIMIVENARRMPVDDNFMSVSEIQKMQESPKKLPAPRKESISKLRKSISLDPNMVTPEKNEPVIINQNENTPEGIDIRKVLVKDFFTQRKRKAIQIMKEKQSQTVMLTQNSPKEPPPRMTPDVKDMNLSDSETEEGSNSNTGRNKKK